MSSYSYPHGNRQNNKRKALSRGAVERGIQPEMEHQDARVEADGRYSAPTMQGQILVRANFDPEENVKRMKMSRYITNPYAPASQNPDDYQMRQGQVAMCIDDGKSGFGRNELQSGTTLTVTGTPAGLDETVKLFCPGVVAGDPHEGNEQLTLKIQGVDMICNYDSHAIRAGDKLVVEPIPNMIPQGPNKQLVPAVYGPKGVSENKFSWRVRGTNPQRQQAAEQQLLDESRVRMGLEDPNGQENDFKSKVQKANDYKDIVDILGDHCKAIFDEMYRVSEMDPLRGFLEIHAAKFLLNMVLKGMIANNDPSKRHAYMCRQALVAILIKVNEFYLKSAVEFFACIPGHFKQDADLQEFEAHGQSLETGVLKSFLDPKQYPNHAAKDWKAFASLCADIDMLFDYYARLQSWRVQDYLRRYTLGMALSSADVGKNYDIFIGRPS